MISYKSTKLSTIFPVKDKTDFQYKHNIVYYGNFPNEECKMTMLERQKDAL